MTDVIHIVEEHVARVLFAWQEGHDDWDEAHPIVREDYLEAARAMLFALDFPKMMEPCDE